MSLSSPAIIRTALPASRRSLAPDLARGLMLLLIAVAHAHMFLAHGITGYRGYAVDGTPIDRVVAGVQVLLVDGHALPMFAALFGYGLARLVDRQTRGGGDWPAARRIVRRRGAWLLAFGFAHALLLFFGDILAAYGLVGLLGVALLRARDKTLIGTAAVAMLIHIGVEALLGLSAEAAGHESAYPTDIADPLEAMAMRLAVWSGLTWAYQVTVVPALALGVWAARRRLLDEPERHRALLARIAAWGVPIGVIGGVPLMLFDTGLWTPGPELSVPFYVLHNATGVATGFGYAALIGLIAARRRRHRATGRLTAALAACGQRSLTCYLLQSVAFVAVFAPYAGGLGDDLGDAAASGIAVLVWAATVVLAALMAKVGHRGPAENLLRRLTYGRR
jgi:uncharacterized protein